MHNDRPNRLPWPPMIYLAAVAIGLVVDVNFPLPWVTGPFTTVLQVMGAVVGLGALILDVVTVKTFRDHQTTILPHKGATNLITSGPFAWSRNPIYLGNTLLVLGVGLYFGKLWLVILAPIAAFITQKLAIEREEQHLQAKFGVAWMEYASKVRRWF